MLGVTIGPVAGHPESPAAGEEPAMTSPVFPVPLIPLRTRSYPVRGAAPARPCWTEFDDTDTPLAVTVEERGEVCVVHADGEVDIATAPLLGSALEAGLAGGRATLVIDLRQISFVDCTGIGLLTAARCRAHGQGTRLRILAGRAVARTAALLELTTALGLHKAG